MPKSSEPLQVSASDLKNAWHEHLERVSRARQEVVVTRYGRPIARLTPYEEPEARSGIFGSLAGSVTVHADLTAPLGEAWNADG